MSRPSTPHGSRARYATELRSGVEPCGPCKAGAAAYAAHRRVDQLVERGWVEHSRTRLDDAVPARFVVVLTDALSGEFKALSYPADYDGTLERPAPQHGYIDAGDLGVELGGR